MIIERTDVLHPLWRKKVDGTLLRLALTPIPMWVARMWNLDAAFRQVTGRKDTDARIRCIFKGISYACDIVPHREGKQFRLFVDEPLRAALAETFLMTRMRDLDAKLASGAVLAETPEAAFWEFLDLEYDAVTRGLRMTAHYVQRPTFPNLFARLAGSPPMRRIADELAGHEKPRIHKQAWRPRSDVDGEIGAKNVIYMLADVVNRLVYVGEAQDMLARFRRGHEPIPHWTHYRYDLLPELLAPLRVTLERMLICDVDGILGRWVTELPVAPGSFSLANSRIDR